MNLKTPELRASLKELALAAFRCANPDISQLKFERFRLHKGRAFEISDDVINAQNDFVRQAIRKLGPVKGHAKVLDGVIWDFIVSIKDTAQLDDAKSLNQTLDLIEEKAASVCEFFRPCPLVRLPKGVNHIEIGRVAIDLAEARIENLKNTHEHLNFSVSNDWAFYVVPADNKKGVAASLPPTLWSINLAAADPVREEEGLWLTDVALTLLRLCVKRDDLGVMAPTIGKVEAHPFFPHQEQDNSLTFKPGGNATLGGRTAPNDYRLTSGAIASLLQFDNKSKIDQVFDAAPKSIAERFYQGCGWLTRGRRSNDRSDRLLYFFTAIEALLSDSDKSSPVSQTIARNAAVLITDDIKLRQIIATDIKQLYGVRSALVHAGARGAFDIDSNSAQQVVELLFEKVWNEIDLSMNHQNFSNALGKASYGLPLGEVLPRLLN